MRYVQVNLLENFKNMLTTTLVIKLSDEVASWFHFSCQAPWVPISLSAIRCNEIGRLPKALKRDKRFIESVIWVNASKRHVSQRIVSKLMYELYVYPIRLCMHEKCFMLQVSTAGQTWFPVGFQLKGKSWVFTFMIRYLYEWFMLNG
jgi:hypothetical protein